MDSSFPPKEDTVAEGMNLSPPELLSYSNAVVESVANAWLAR